MTQMRWLLLFLLIGGCAGQPHYRVVELKPLPGFHFSDANDIDDAGVAYGYCEENEVTRNTLWRGGVPAASDEQPKKPGRRDVVGAETRQAGSGIYYAIVRKDKKVYDLNQCIDRPNEWELWSARAMNRKGQIVGAGLYQGRNRGFLLIPAGAKKSAPTTAKAKQPAESKQTH